MSRIPGRVGNNTEDTVAMEKKQKKHYMGHPEKILLVSNSMGYWLPEEDDIVEQRLTIRKDGRVYVSYYPYTCFRPGLDTRAVRKKQFRIAPEAAEDLLVEISGCIKEDPEMWIVTDVGSWDLTIFDETGGKLTFNGPLSACFEGCRELCSKVRKTLDLGDLFVFDGECRELVDVEDGELIYVSVSFREGGDTYCYISDDADIMEDDVVLVPVGENNIQTKALVEEIDVFTPELAPYPPEECKHVLKVLRDE